MFGLKNSEKKDKKAEKRPVRFYILGNIQRPGELSRMEAERIIHHCWGFDFSKKSKEELEKYNNNICVAHLKTEIIMRAPVDVEWIFDDTSLYQRADGNFFIANCDCAPYAGGQRLYHDLEKNYFETHTVKEFFELNESELKISESDLKKLFEKREITFYAERWCSYDYQVLFGLFGTKYDPKKEDILEKVEEYKKQFEDCSDREILCAHIEKEAQKAVEAIENNSWPDLGFDLDVYNPSLAEYK